MRVEMSSYVAMFYGYAKDGVIGTAEGMVSYNDQS